MRTLIRAALVATGVLGGLVLATAPAVAQSDQDANWLRAAHQGNLAEIAAGNTAREKGASQEVRSIGALLVADHTALDANVRNTARRLGVSLPESPPPEQRAELTRVAAMSGAAFDRAWVEAMIKSHRAALANGEQQMRSGSAPEARQIAASSAPVIQRHIDRLLRARTMTGTTRSVRTIT
jgi:putative membrane protein